MSYTTKYLNTLSDALRMTTVADGAGVAETLEGGMRRLVQAAEKVRSAGQTIWFAGNGASAAMASHMALDFSKNARVRAQSLNDPVAVTAIGNDLGYEHIFGQPLRWHGKRGDGVVLISSSGLSANVIEAAEAARSEGMWIVTLSGLSVENPLRGLGDLNFYIDARTYGIVECAHQVLLHMWLDRLMGVEDWALQASQNMRLTT